MFDGLAFLELIDARPLVRASRFRLGPMRTRGVPAILCGAAAIVAAAGVSAALARLAGAVPETIRETRLFLTALRSNRPAMLE